MPKRVGNRVYVHKDGLRDLAEYQVASVRKAERALPRGFAWNVVRVEPGLVMFGHTTSWQSDPHPALQRSVRVRFTPQGPKASGVQTYKRNPPIYHRKEQFVTAAHPLYARFEALTRAEEAAGLLSRSDIGRQVQWRNLLRNEGYRIVGHRLEKSR